jgi:hypothetical protein
MKTLLILTKFYFCILVLYVQGEMYVEFESANTLAFKDSIGQIGGIEIDLNDDLVVFHRADRKWSNE